MSTANHNPEQTMATTSAAIYDADTRETITEGLQPSSVCDEAWRAAQRIAAERGADVLLVDSDGDWTVHPDGTTEEATR